MVQSNKLKIATVSELMAQVKQVVNTTFDFVAISGAVTNFSGSASGHFYFSLSDQDSLVNAIVFRSVASRYPLLKKLKDGDQIECVAEVTVYEKRGNVQLVIRQIRLAGEAGLKLEYQRIKSKLESLGLFSLDRKKTIPDIPKKVAVITAPGSAAVQDFVNIVRRRKNLIDVMIVGSLVQGKDASRNIITALEKVTEYNKKAEIKCDLVIICRGGGSLEDLWSFNEEALAVFVSDYSLPVISAVGHQTDYTILDYVSDLRAETPSAAAEIITQKSFDSIQRLLNIKKNLIYLSEMKLNTFKVKVEEKKPINLKEIIFKKLRDYQRRLDRLTIIQRPEKYLKIYENLIHLNQLQTSLMNVLKNKVKSSNDRLFICHNGLKNLNPKSVLGRGYLIAFNSSGNIIKSVEDVPNEKFRLTFHDGETNVKKTD